jgi:hypothetical protein
LYTEARPRERASDNFSGLSPDDRRFGGYCIVESLRRRPELDLGQREQRVVAAATDVLAGWMRVRWRTMMVPAVTTSPSKRFTPRRWLLSAPVAGGPPPLSTWRYPSDSGDLDGGVVLPVTPALALAGLVLVKPTILGPAARPTRADTDAAERSVGFADGVVDEEDGVNSGLEPGARRRYLLLAFLDLILLATHLDHGT